MNSSVVFIEGETICLRTLCTEDCQGEYLKWFNDADLCKYNTHHRYPETVESLIEYVTRANRSTDMLVLAIVDKISGKHVGNASLQNINYLNRSAEVANIVAEKKHTGLSYTVESIQLLLQHGFDTLNLNRIYGGTMNPVMVGLMERIGFKKEGTRRAAIYKNGKYYDVVEYGILRAEWVSEISCSR